MSWEVLLAIWVALFLINRLYNARTRPTWLRAVVDADHGWQMDGDVLVRESEIGTMTLSLRSSSRDGGVWRLHVAVAGAAWGGAKLGLRGAGVGTSQLTGDAAFDEVVRVTGDEAAVLAGMTAEARDRVRGAVRGKWQFADGAWVYEGTSGMHKMPTLDYYVELAEDLASYARRDGSIAEVLERRALEEPDECACRAFLVQRVTCAESLPDEFVELILLRGDLASAWLAAHLNDAEQLFAIADASKRPLVQFSCLRHLASRGSDPRVARGLAELLDHGQLGSMAVEQLIRAGTTEQVPALRAIAGRVLDGRRAAAAEAIEAIQARANATVGQLSLADVAGGDLSVAEGQVDVAEAEARRQRAARRTNAQREG